MPRNKDKFKPLVETYVPAGENGHEDTRTFITLAGKIKAELLPVPLLLMEKLRGAQEREWKEAGRALPVKPTYTAEIAGGATQVHEHNLTTLVTDEDKAAWAEYEATQRAWDNESSMRMVRAVLLYGVKLDLPKDDEWIEKQKAVFGILVPENKSQRYLHYLETEVLRTQDDIATIMQKVMELSGIDEEAIKAATASFPGDAQPGAAGQAENPARAVAGE